MLLLAADENFNGDIVRGLLRRQTTLNIVRLQDVKLSGAEDSVVLAWAAQEGRVLLTHDVSTITRYAYERIQAGQSMPGVFEVSRKLPVGSAIEEILLLTECSVEREWEGQVRYRCDESEKIGVLRLFSDQFSICRIHYNYLFDYFKYCYKPPNCPEYVLQFLRPLSVGCFSQ